MNIKLKKLIESSDKKQEVNERLALPPWKLDQITNDIVNTYFVSKHDTGRMSSMEKGVEQNKMLKDLRTSIKGAIKSVLKNYPGIYSFDDTKDIWKQ